MILRFTKILRLKHRQDLSRWTLDSDHSYSLQIMRAFDNMSASDLTNGMKVGESTIYNSADQSAEIRLFRRMAFGSPDFSSDFFSQGTQHSGESAEDRV